MPPWGQRLDRRLDACSTLELARAYCDRTVPDRTTGRSWQVLQVVLRSFDSGHRILRIIRGDLRPQLSGILAGHDRPHLRWCHAAHLAEVTTLLGITVVVSHRAQFEVGQPETDPVVALVADNHPGGDLARKPFSHTQRWTYFLWPRPRALSAITPYPSPSTAPCHKPTSESAVAWGPDSRRGCAERGPSDALPGPDRARSWASSTRHQ